MGQLNLCNSCKPWGTIQKISEVNALVDHVYPSSNTIGEYRGVSVRKGGQGTEVDDSKYSTSVLHADA